MSLPLHSCPGGSSWFPVALSYSVHGSKDVCSPTVKFSLFQSEETHPISRFLVQKLQRDSNHYWFQLKWFYDSLLQILLCPTMHFWNKETGTIHSIQGAVGPQLQSCNAVFSFSFLFLSQFSPKIQFVFLTVAEHWPFFFQALYDKT